MFSKLFKLFAAVFGFSLRSRNEKTTREPKPGQAGHIPPFKGDTRLLDSESSAFKLPQIWLPLSKNIILDERGKRFGFQITEVLRPRNCGGEDVSVIFLDLSNSIRYIAEEVALGYNAMRLSLAEKNLRVILVGFNSRLFLLHDGKSRDMPKFGVDFFSGRQTIGTLQPETRLFFSIFVGGILFNELESPRSLSMIWFTDGIASRGDRESHMEPAARAIAMLVEQEVPIELIGIENSKMDHGNFLREVEELFCMAEKQMHGNSSASSKTVPISPGLPATPLQSFVAGATFIVESLRQGSKIRDDDTTPLDN